MAITLAFDVYGTLIDTHGVVSALQEIVGHSKAMEFSRVWREKQLEYSFRRGLMQKYENFAVCTSHALDYSSRYCSVPLTKEQKQGLLNCYRTLPPFEDVKEGLTRLKKANFRLYAFSNGTADAVETLLEAAGIRDFFQGVVSTDELKSFKPNPAVYTHFLRKSGSTGGSSYLISSNPFDVIGAISAGLHAAWIQRTKGSVFDPWGIEPTITVESLLELNEKLQALSHG